MNRVLETSLPFRERDVGWPLRQAPTALIKLKPVQSNPNPRHMYLRSDFMIILPSMQTLSIHIYRLKHFMCLKKFHACYALHPYQYPWFGHPNNVCWIYKLQSSSFRNSPLHCYILYIHLAPRSQTSQILKGSRSIPGQWKWDLWWTKWHRDRFYVPRTSIMPCH